MMKIKAPVNTVIVEPIMKTERGGIVLPGVSEDHQRARVVAVGDRVTRTGVHVPSELKKMILLYIQYLWDKPLRWMDGSFFPCLTTTS